MNPAAFVILLTFMAGPGSPFSANTLRCGDRACVDRIVAHAHDSPLLARLRVFSGEPGILISGNSVFPPTLDMWLQ